MPPSTGQDQPITLGITGRIGAGKTTAGKYFESAYGFQYIRYSLVLSEWRAEGQEAKDRLQAVGWEVMAGGKQEELNRRLIARIDPQVSCAVDGLRHPVDFESLKNRFADRFFLLYIDCPPEIRWQHSKGKTRRRSYDKFLEADAHLVEQQIEVLRPKAYAIIPNLGSLQQFESELDVVLKRIRSGERT